ncbi:hypothetical protein [Gimesia fumaroli]|uniref:Uncharacterized protein n=1 Tax=Gimesia fumaroli TaxID=2527976 RepID=A0A518I9E7_9PLAN|nr:hypothetical protein [Gimesia fumaroli]QDV49741.1 hypothetical protein Enr17x_17620 [Gimesia fumaroli]
MSQDETLFHFGSDVDTYPLDQPLVLRSGIAVFTDDCEKVDESGDDVKFLKSLPEIEVWYGAITPSVSPFLAVTTPVQTRLPTARRVLELLRASCFESEHIKSLDVVNIPFPGYHPRTKNDEIHSDPQEQCLFAKDEKDQYELDDNINDPEWRLRDEQSRGCHASLRAAVLENHLYYVQIHAKPKVYDGSEYREYVIVFAVGVSRASGNLIGMVSFQVCHNLCD